MKRMLWAMALFVFVFAPPLRAQMGMDLFKRPSLTKFFHPVVGKGAEYQTVTATGSNTRTRTMQMGIVGKESVDGKDGYWMEFVSNGEGSSMIGKSLMTVDDFQFHRIIFMMPGKGAMEMPITPDAAQKNRVQESLQDWHSVGSETITVPAGTFSCDHYKNDKTGGEIWTSDKITPYGLVKEQSKDHSMILVKVLDTFPDQITGPVQKFDPQALMQQMQQQRQHPTQ
ncbi:MAG: hypothetical protein WBR26_14390 [Candidatus Acidiferrum sp.]